MKNLLKLSLLFIFTSTYSQALDSSITYRSEYSTLSKDNPSWKSNYLQALFKQDGRSYSIKGESVERYNTSDEKVELSFLTPFFDNFSWEIDYAHANDGIIIPENSIYNKIHYNIKDLFAIAYGYKENSYATNSKNKIHDVEIEKYYKDFRFAFDTAISTLNNEDDSISNKATIHYFYNDNYTAFSYSFGEEAEATQNKIITSKVKSTAIYGEYNLQKNWAVGYSFEHVRQDDLYIRRTVSLAAIYRF